MLSIHVPPIRQTESAGLRCRFMGHTHVTVTFRNPRHPERQWQGLCLVDTEATDCLIPAEAVEALGLAPRGEVTVVLANEQETRLLFAGAVLIATVSGEADETVVKEIERLLGPGAIPPKIKPDVIREDLPRRIEFVNERVPLMRRAQVIRDLCVIARADRRIRDAEMKIISDIAAAVGVDQNLVTCHMTSKTELD